MTEDEVFWERIREMPAWEAEQECVLRREKLTANNADLQAKMTGELRQEHRAAFGSAVFRNNAQLTKLGEHIKYFRKLQDRIQWRETVRALFGDEAVEECLVHMERAYTDVWHGRRKMKERTV